MGYSAFNENRISYIRIKVVKVCFIESVVFF